MSGPYESGSCAQEICANEGIDTTGFKNKENNKENS